MLQNFQITEIIKPLDILNRMNVGTSILDIPTQWGAFGRDAFQRMDYNNSGKGSITKLFGEDILAIDQQE